jgi:biotin--protein ligase
LVLGVVAADDPAATAEFGRRFRAVEGHPPVRLGEVDASRFDAALYFRTLKAARQAALRTEELAAMALPAEQATNASLPLPSDLRAGSLLLHAHQCASTQEFMRAHSAGPLAIAAQAAAQTDNGWNEPKPLLPDGAALIADEQGDGRGRGGNRWASPGGCLMFTCLRSLRVPGQLAPFINYAVCLAVVEGAREAAAEAAAEALRRAAQAAVNGGGGADDQEAITRAARAAADSLPLRVKWPNDIYCSWDGPLGGGGGAGSSSSAAPDPSPSPSLQAIPDPRDPTGLPPVVKIGGALIHTTFSGGGKFSVLTGVGLNVSNRAPTTCLDALLERALPSAGQQGGLEAAAARGGVAVRREVLLAHVLARLDACFASLEARGFAPLERRYLAAWLHSGQRLALAGPEQGGPAPGSPVAMAAAAGEGGGGKAGGAVITVAGLSPSGFLLGVDDAGGQYELTPDGNSLDMMAGLLRRRL